MKLEQEQDLVVFLAAEHLLKANRNRPVSTSKVIHEAAARLMYSSKPEIGLRYASRCVERLVNQGHLTYESGFITSVSYEGVKEKRENELKALLTSVQANDAAKAQKRAEKAKKGLRDRFAIAAMERLIDANVDFTSIGRSAYIMADAMLEARNV